MNKFISIVVLIVLLIGLFISNAYATNCWGVDENGKYSFRKIIVIIKDEYSQEAEIIINHLQSTYPIEKVEITSEDGNVSSENYLILVLNLQELDEDKFNSIFEALSKDNYVEKAFKDYYMTPNNSYLGDIDQDGKITTDDARTILRDAAGQTQISTETEKYLADANQDGIITIQDAVDVLKISCKI